MSLSNENQNNIENSKNKNTENNFFPVKPFFYNNSNKAVDDTPDLQQIKQVSNSNPASHFYGKKDVFPGFYSEKDFIGVNGNEEISIPENETKNNHINTEFEENELEIAQTKKNQPESDEQNSAISVKKNLDILSSLKPDDIKNAKVSLKRKSDILRRLIMALLMMIIIVSTVNIFYELHLKKVANEYYEKIRQDFYSENVVTTAQTPGFLMQDIPIVAEERLYSDDGDIYMPINLDVMDMHDRFEKMLPNLNALKDINSNVFAWIKVDGTRVDYPVVKSPYNNNEYYLSHALDKTYNVSGAIFTDFANNTNLSKNRNTCVYGHNMNDGTMFQTIMNFKTKNQFLNSKIEIFTVDGIYVYTPISTYEAEPTEMFFHTQFADDEHFQVFLDDIISKSIFRAPITPNVSDKIVTLITCTNTIPDKRFVVHGVLKEIVK